MMSREIADKLADMMDYTVDNYYGNGSFSDSLDVCAKTGTAEISESGKDAHAWVTGFTTTGRYPDYVFTAKGQPDVTQVGPVTGFTIQVHFDDADTFTATPAGVIVGADGVATGIPAEAIQFKRISANSKQTQN